ncbi:MAG: FAD-binding protein, partial [Candidatus Bathyarchaeia archaeon]
MSRAEPAPFPIGVIEERAVNEQNVLDRTKLIKFKKIDSGVSITDSDVIVAGGRGVGGREGFELLGRRASILGGAVGASRAAVDEGWIDYAHQVVLSGRTVRPKLYI